MDGPVGLAVVGAAAGFGATLTGPDGLVAGLVAVGAAAGFVAVGLAGAAAGGLAGAATGLAGAGAGGGASTTFSASHLRSVLAATASIKSARTTILITIFKLLLEFLFAAIK